jgi:hypothetical protein
VAALCFLYNLPLRHPVSASGVTVWRWGWGQPAHAPTAGDASDAQSRAQDPLPPLRRSRQPPMNEGGACKVRACAAPNQPVPDVLTLLLVGPRRSWSEHGTSPYNQGSAVPPPSPQYSFIDCINSNVPEA